MLIVATNIMTIKMTIILKSNSEATQIYNLLSIMVLVSSVEPVFLINCSPTDFYIVKIIHENLESTNLVFPFIDSLHVRISPIT
jgi:hypothetical protein